MQKPYRDKVDWYKAAKGLTRSNAVFPLKLEDDSRIAFTRVGDAEHQETGAEIGFVSFRFDKGAVVDADRLLVDDEGRQLIRLIFDHYESTLRIETAVQLFGSDQIDRLIAFSVSHLEEGKMANGHPEHGLWG